MGYIHPPDRYTAYLKYTPAGEGKWARGEVFYHRELAYYHVANVLKTLDFLERHHPRYVWFDPMRELRFSFVPHDAVVTYYVPEQRLAALVADPRDPLEEDARDVVALIASHAGLGPETFGVTGSILLNLHNPAFSDIDLTVYGRDGARAVRRAVESLRRRGELRDVWPERLRSWRRETSARFALTAAEVADIEARRWNYFRFRDRYVSVHPTRRDDEITEPYGHERCRRDGIATIEATVMDARDGLFLPAVYRVSDVVIVDGPPRPVESVVSFEGLYSGIADEDDRIVAHGQLEASGNGNCRLIVGAGTVPGGGYMKRKMRI